MGRLVQVLGVSIWTFQGPLSEPAAVKQPLLPWSTVWLPILALYTPAHLFCCVVATSFVLLPAAHASAVWAGGLLLYYLLTSQGVPQHTGARPRPCRTPQEHWWAMYIVRIVGRYSH